MQALTTSPWYVCGTPLTAASFTDNAEVLRRANDTQYGLGASIWTTPTLELFSGMGLMSAAVPSKTLEASLPDFLGVTFSLGARLRASERLSFALSLAHIVSPAREAHSQLADYESPSRLPDASGHYTQSVSYADLNVALRF